MRRLSKDEEDFLILKRIEASKQQIKLKEDIKRKERAQERKLDRDLNHLVKEAMKVTPADLNFYDNIFNWKKMQG